MRTTGLGRLSLLTPLATTEISRSESRRRWLVRIVVGATADGLRTPDLPPPHRAGRVLVVKAASHSDPSAAHALMASVKHAGVTEIVGCAHWRTRLVAGTIADTFLDEICRREQALGRARRRLDCAGLPPTLGWCQCGPIMPPGPIIPCIIARIPSFTNPVTSRACARIVSARAGSSAVSSAITPVGVKVSWRR
jgi:hypothetical protein